MNNLKAPKQKQKYLSRLWLLLGSISLLGGIINLVISLVSNTVADDAFTIGCLFFIGIIGTFIGIFFQRKNRNF